MATLGYCYSVGMAVHGCCGIIAQRASWQAGDALHTQTAQRHSVPDLRVHAGRTVCSARQGLSRLVLQSPSFFRICLILHRHGNAGLLRPGCANSPDSHRAHNCMDCGCCAVFCQLGIRYRVCEVTFCPFSQASLYITNISAVWRGEKYRLGVWCISREIFCNFSPVRAIVITQRY